jgi:AcrR family transcriptional regulator
MADRLATGAFDSLSMDEIATAAGVSPATLYRYFPSREALLSALAHDTLFQRLGDLPFPQRPEEIASIMRQSFVAFDRDPAFTRSYFDTELGRAARSLGRPDRIAAIVASLRPLTAGLAEGRRVEVEAVIAYLASIQAWITMRDEFSLTGEQIGNAVTWAIDTLLADLRRDEAGTARQVEKGSTRDTNE